MTALIKDEENYQVDSQMLNREKLELLKATICKDSTDDEFQLFVHACKRTGLDPFMKQVHAVKRWDSNLKRMSMTIQTGIDGYRLIAERTGRYCPGKEPTFVYDNEGKLVSATAYVKKQTRDGTWHEVSACAYFDEYCQKTKEGQPVAMWKNMPRGQLSKCAESLALRKAFPAELSGVYTKEEMEQSETIETTSAKIIANQPAPKQIQVKEVKKPGKEQLELLSDILSQCEPEFVKDKLEKIKKLPGVSDINDINTTTFAWLMDLANKNKVEYSNKINEEIEKSEKHDESLSIIG